MSKPSQPAAPLMPARKTAYGLAIFAATLLAFLFTSSAQNPVEADLFPPDFLVAQREALGLSDAQLQDIQAIMQDIQPKFEALKGQLEERGKAFQESLHIPQPDLAQTEDKLRNLLAQENEMKVLQVRLMLSLRSKLTAEQLDKARQLRHQAAGKDPHDGAAQRLQKKFEELRAAIEQRAFGGAPPEEIVKQVGEIQKLAQSGQPLEAERQIDELIARLREGKK